MIRYNIIKITPFTENLIHKGIPSESTAKMILHDMELNAMGAGDQVESYPLGFVINRYYPLYGYLQREIYRVEEAQFA